MNKLKTLTRSERGQAVAEFALVLPLLLILVFGVIQFGIVFRDYLALTDATRAGARKAAVSRMSADPNATAVSAVDKAAADLDQSKLDVQVNSTWQQGQDLQVTSSYPYAISILGLVVKSGQLHTTVTERVE
jgi:Flp pilus assembly protein TadG